MLKLLNEILKVIFAMTIAVAIVTGVLFGVGILLDALLGVFDGDLFLTFATFSCMFILLYFLNRLLRS